MKSLYDELGVNPQASQQEVKDAFRRLAAKHHPDRDGGDKEAFQKAAAAYEILGDAELRERYDQTGQTTKPQERSSLARHILAEILLNNIDQFEPERVDIVEFLRTVLRQKIQHGEASVTNLKYLISRRERAIAAIQRKHTDKQILVDLLQGDILTRQQLIKQNESKLEDHRKALELLADTTVAAELLGAEV